MQINDFQKECLKFEPPYLTRGEENLMGILGLNSAAGDLMGLCGKAVYKDAGMPQEDVLQALGEIIIYLCISAHAADIDLESVLKKSLEIVRDAPKEKDSDAGDRRAM